MLICKTDAVWTQNIELLLRAMRLPSCPAGLWGHGGGRASAKASRELGWGRAREGPSHSPWNVGVWTLATVNSPWNVWDLDSAAVNGSLALGFGPCRGQWHFDILQLALQRPTALGHQGLDQQRPTTLGHHGLDPAKANGLWILTFSLATANIPQTLAFAMAHVAHANRQMETQREARGLRMSQQFPSQTPSHQLLSPRAPEVGELRSRLAVSRKYQELTVHKAQQDGSEALEREKARPALTLEEKELSLRSLEENNLAWMKQVSQLHSALHQGEQLLSDCIGELQELNTQIRSLQEAVQEKAAAQATREEQLLQELEESRAGERCLRDSVQLLEAEISELRLRLRSSEDRAEALATQCQQASGAHCEAQSQLDKLLLLVYRMTRDSSDLVTWSSEKGHDVSLSASQASDVPTELMVDRVAAALQDHLEHSRKDLNDVRKKSQALKLQLSTMQAQKDYFSARNQELQKQLAKSQEVMWRAEHKNSLETALKEEATARKEEAVTLHQEVESLQSKVENTEKKIKDVLYEPDSLQANKEKLECQIKLLEEPVTASEMRANTAMDRNSSLQELQTVMSIIQIKKEKPETQERPMEMLQQEAAEMQGHLTRMTADPSEWEREIQLYQMQMRMLEEKNLMHTTTLKRKELNQMRREAEREAMREELEHVAAALKQRENGELEWRKKAQALSAALAKSEISKGTLRKKLTILQSTAPGRDTDWPCAQQAAGAEGKQLSRHPRKGLECLLGLVASSEEHREEGAQRCASRNLGQVEHQWRSQKGCCRHQERENLLPVPGDSKELK